MSGRVMQTNGMHTQFADRCGLGGYSESRIEFGMMYRIKCFLYRDV